jgi:hypothetical protein
MGECLKAAEVDDAASATPTDMVVGGYLCRLGSYAYKPLYSNVEYIQPLSSTFYSYNGPVIPGYYVDATTGDPEPCAVTTFQPGYYTSACLECYEGRYCPDTAMDDLAHFKCDSGYVCKRGNQISNPGSDDVVVMNAAGDTEIGWKCDQTYQCPSNLYH